MKLMLLRIMQDMQFITILLGEQLAMLEQKLVKRRQTPQVFLFTDGNWQRQGRKTNQNTNTTHTLIHLMVWCVSSGNHWLHSLGMDQKWRWKQWMTKLCSRICFDKEASDRSCNTQPHGRESQDATSVMLLAVINGTRLKNSACVRGLGWIARRK